MPQIPLQDVLPLFARQKCPEEPLGVESERSRWPRWPRWLQTVRDGTQAWGGI